MFLRFRQGTGGRARCAYQRPYPNPLAGSRGDILQPVLDGSQEYSDVPGWTWCRAADGRLGWVPDAWCQPLDDGWRLKRDFAALELTVRAGDRLTLHYSESGFVFCTARAGEQGWLPDAVLEVNDQDLAISSAKDAFPGPELAPWCLSSTGTPMTAIDSAIAERYLAVQEIAREAARRGLDFYHQRGALPVAHKGDDPQDVVSIADETLEELIRQRLSERFPEDGLLGEEGGATDLSAAYLWVMDPIDGTAPFLNGLHSWCVSIGLLHRGEPLLGAIMDPNHGELFHGLRGHGAFVNDQPLRVHAATEVRQGLTGLGTTHRRGQEHLLPFVTGLLAAGGQFFRNGSGALMTAYVAAGRLIGYYETLIHGWDCLAGLVLIQEVGGRHNDFLRNDGLVNGNPLLVAAPGVYDQLAALVGPSLDA